MPSRSQRGHTILKLYAIIFLAAALCVAPACSDPEADDDDDDDDTIYNPGDDDDDDGPTVVMCDETPPSCTTGVKVQVPSSDTSSRSCDMAVPAMSSIGTFRPILRNFTGSSPDSLRRFGC